MKKLLFAKRIGAMGLCIITVALAIISSPVSRAEEAQEESNFSQSDTTIKYAEYNSSHAEEGRPEDTVTIDAAVGYAQNSAELSVGKVGEKENSLIWSNDGGEVTWSFSVKQSGNYSVRISYYSLNDEAFDIQFGLKIDGAFPFFEAEKLKLAKPFSFDGEKQTDKKGNDIRPDPVSYTEWTTAEISDITGCFNEPYSIYLDAGNHTLSLVGIKVKAAFDIIEFYNADNLSAYSEYAKNVVPFSEHFSSVIQAEEPLYTSSKSIYPTYDRTSADTEPNDPVKLRYNTIGQSNYSSVGDYIVWNVNVPEDGYYYLSARVRQNTSTGMVSYRRLYVNGKVPFAEANSIKISFNYKWQNFVFGGDEPWLIHLNKGDNQIKLEVVSGDMAEIIGKLNDLISKINTLYRKIIMITGTSPDSYRDYKLGSVITDFYEMLNNILEESGEISDYVSELGVDSSSGFSAVDKLVILIKSFIDDDSKVTNQISTLNSYASSLSSLVTSIATNPLELDTLTVSADTDGLKPKKKTTAQKLLFQCRAFIGTFAEDYYNGNYNSKDTINVWLNSGRDQANIIQRLADSKFTPKTDINVNVSLVQQSLVQASLSGSGPDIALLISGSEVVNLAMRNGLVSISDFNGFDKVSKRFPECSTTPYYYNGSCYAVPLTQSYPMLFCRTDIFSDLGIDVPETWDDFYRAIRVLQRNNLTVGIPNSDAANVMSVNTTIFQTLLYQSGERMYSNDLKTTNLDSEDGVQAFTQWTDFYKTYGLPYQFDFFNRFRSGDMPMGIFNYSLYGKLTDVAPEISGLWEMYMIPGMTNEYGVTEHSVCATGTGAVILRGSRHKDAAWKFLDWFTDTEAQTDYGNELEILLGASGRYETANTKAFSNLPWTDSELNTLLKQRAEIFTVPEVPGGYLVERNLINAFRKVVFYSANPRETIMSYNKNIEYEMKRKREEFNLD